MNWPYLVIIILLRLCAGHDSGGGIRVTGAGNCSYVWTSCNISHNTATGDGGGLWVSSEFWFVFPVGLDNISFVNNTASRGRSIFTSGSRLTWCG